MINNNFENIICLGNFNRLYKKTRHNVGIWFVEVLFDKFNIKKDVYLKNLEFGFYYFFDSDKLKLKIFIPNEYMNNNWKKIILFMNKFSINKDSVIFIHDDVNINVGYYKIRYNNKHYCHNGLRGIANNIYFGSNFNKLSIGISRNNNIDLSNYVLSKPSKEEKLIIIGSLNDFINKILFKNE